MSIAEKFLSKEEKTELERDRLALRREYLEAPARVEYGLSEQAQRLRPILVELIQRKMAGAPME